jgi:hypothetical protein
VTDNRQQESIVFAVTAKTMDHFMWFTGVKCIIGAVVLVAACGWGTAPVAIPGILASLLIARHWRRPLRSFPAALWLSSVFWLAAAVVLAITVANPAEWAGVVSLVAIGLWDMGAAALDVQE